MRHFPVIRLIEELQQVPPICRLAVSGRQAAELIASYKTFHISVLLRAADQQPLPMLNRSDELRCLEQRIVSSGVEPGVAAAELDDMKFPQLQIAPVDVGNLQLAASRRA